MKLCGFGMFDSQWSAESIKPLIHNLLEQYGSERLLFASNFPVDKLMSDYDAVVDKVRQALSGVSDAELQGIFRDNAMRVYNL
jgi:predicted TIM-barrel fold metal-dependent hydrolase